MEEMAAAKSSKLSPLRSIYRLLFLSQRANLLQFLLEPSLFSDVIDLWTLYGTTVKELTYYINRTFLYNLHRERLKLINEW